MNVFNIIEILKILKYVNYSYKKVKYHIQNLLKQRYKKDKRELRGETYDNC